MRQDPEQQLFATIVTAHQEALRRLLRRLTGGDAMRADDLAQEAFVKAWQSRHSFRGEASVGTWLMTIAYRTFLDDERRLSSRLNATLGDTTPQPATSSHDSLPLDIDTALATLSATERTCIVLQAMEGRSIKDIATITALPENTVKSHLSRGKQRLATYLRHNGYEAI